jgi:hypothetical protein
MNGSIARFLAAGLLSGTAWALGPAAVAAEEAPKPELKAPVIRLKGLSPGGQPGGLFALRFAVTNSNTKPVPYSGYLSSSFTGGLPKGTIAPLYHMEVRREGAWKPHNIGFCGFGRGPVQLEPKETVVFDVHVSTEGWDAVRVGIAYGSPERSEKANVAWSEPLTVTRIRELHEKQVRS